MNTNTAGNSALCILALIGMLAFGGCSQKPSSEEIAAQVRAAMAEEKAKEQAAASAPAPAPVAAPAASAPPKRAAKPRPVARAESVQPAPVIAAPVQAEPAAPVPKVVCNDCGVVVSVKEVELTGKGSGLGAIAGGVAGGVVGHQVGSGTGKDLATIAGVLGGALAGNKIEQNVKKTKVYDVTVRMENGEERVLRHQAPPGVVAGDKVKVENNLVIRQ